MDWKTIGIVLWVAMVHGTEELYKNHEYLEDLLPLNEDC